jgi:branched-chain amino acid transport system permease protein
MPQIISLALVIIAIAGLGILFTRKTKRAQFFAFIGSVAAIGLVLLIGSFFDVSVENMFSSLVGFLMLSGTYAILTLGLNVQWGYTGLFNIGVAGFFGVGAYVSTILVQNPANVVGAGTESITVHFFNLPFIVGLLGAMIASGIVALIVGFATLRLRTDYLAIATIGISEILRLIATNERGITIGNRGIENIPQPLHDCLVIPIGVNVVPPCHILGIEIPQFIPSAHYDWFYILIVLGFLFIAFLALERISRSPWGRALRAVREDEDAAMALGKNTFRFKMQSLIVGAIIMGGAGSIVAHLVKFIDPSLFDPLQRTFLVWVMLIVGGTGNNKGAIFGAFLMWGIWTATSKLNDVLPATLITPLGKIDVASQLFGPIRIMAIVIALELILLYRPRGLIAEEKHTSTKIDH